MQIGIRSFAAAAALAVMSMAGSASAATLAGDLCGNKYIALSQDGTGVAPTLCQSGNSTGATSPLPALGWNDGAESGGGTDDNSLFKFTVDTSTGAWSILNKLGYSMLGISIKQGNGFAFYVLDLTKSLSGFYYTGNSAYPTGHDLSHANVWYKGEPTPPAEVPLPAAGLLLAGGLGMIAAVRRRNRLN